MKFKELKARSKLLNPILRIGKKGITPGMVEEIKKLLKKKKLIKIKILSNCPVENRDKMIDEIVSKTESNLITKIGNVFVLYKEKEN